MHLLILLAALGAAPVLDVPLTSGYQQSSTVVSDRSGRGNHGTLVGTPPTAGANSVDFNGTNDGVDLGDADIFSFGNGTTDSPFTISAWINMDDSDGFMIACKGTYGDRGEYLFYTNNAYKLVLQIIDQSVPARILRYYDTPLTAYENQWIYVVAAYGGGGVDTDIDLWLNGVMVDDATSTNGVYVAMENNTYPLYIGKYGATLYADGEISNLKILPEKWTQSDVDREYAIGRRIFADKVDSLYNGLVLDIPFTTSYASASDTIASDRVPNGVDAMTMQGNATLTATGMTLDGTGDFAQHNVANWRSGDSSGTINIWVTPTVVSGYPTLFSAADTVVNTSYFYLSIDPSGKVYVRIQKGASSNIFSSNVCPSGDMTAGNQYMITLSSSGSDYKIHLNGQACTITIGGIGINNGAWFHDLQANLDNLVFGALVRVAVGGETTGTIIDGKQWDRQLTDTEVAKLYTLGPGPHVVETSAWNKQLVLDAPMTTAYAQSTTVVSNRALNGNHGTISGTTVGADGVDLPGSGQYINFGDADTFSFGNGTSDTSLTFNIWVNMDDATNFRMLGKGIYNSNLEYDFSLNSADKLGLTLADESVASCYFNRATTAALTSYEGQWTMFTATYDGSAAVTGITLYINGVEVTAVTDTGANQGSYVAMENLTSELHVGEYAGSFFSNGKVAYGRMYNRELSAAEILYLYNAPKKGVHVEVSP